MGTALKSLTIRGFKSIENLHDFKLRKLNVLIGANGAGKSNFIDFFRMIRSLADEAFQTFINDQGGGDGFFFLGPKKTTRITAHLEFGSNVYEFDLTPTAGGGIQIAEERVQYTGGHGVGKLSTLSSGSLESSLKKRKGDPATMGGGWACQAMYSMRSPIGPFIIFMIQACLPRCDAINPFVTAIDYGTTLPISRRSF